jgi:LL-diaminopimelate aminotransferase
LRIRGRQRALVRAYGDIKDNTDSGQFLAIQHAAAYCLEHPEITEKIAAKYSRRMDGLVRVLQKAGFAAAKPKGSFFLYVKAPRQRPPAGRAPRISKTRRKFRNGLSRKN